MESRETADAGPANAEGVSQRLHLSRRVRLAIVVIACAAQFMVVLDVSVVNIALPSLQRALDFDKAGTQWVVNAYALPFAGLLLLGGRLADLVGRKRIFVAGLALFTGASLIGGLANSAGLLIGARAAQGIGAAVLAPATLTILTTSFPEGPSRTRALATWTAVGIAGGTVGNLVGGVLTEYMSWRWTLLINVPIGVLAAALAVRSVANDRANTRRQRLDFPGAAVVTIGLASLTFGIAQSRNLGWAHPTTILAVTGGLVALILFLVIEARLAPTPLIPLRLLRLRPIFVGNVAMLLAGVCLNPMWYFLTLYMQQVLHYGPLQTGLGFLPHTVVSIVVLRVLTPRLMRYVSSRTLVVVGALIAAAGFLWQSRLGADSGYLSGILGPALIFSTGSGLLNTPLTAIVTSGVDPSDAGAASGVMNTAKQIGGAVGLAVLATIAGDQLGTADALATAYGRAFLVISVVLVAVAIVASALPGRTNAVRTGTGRLSQ